MLALIERHRFDTAFVVPTMMVRLLRLPEAVHRRHDLSSLRQITAAAAACDSAEWLARPGSVGRLVEGAKMRILDEQGQNSPPGTPGEIFARLAAMPDFTYHKRDADRRAVERDGMISVGDVGYLDEAGYLFLCDRKRDRIISGGVNIYPAEIEAALIGVAGVLDCAVFGIPDAEDGEAVCAALCTAPGTTADAVRDALRARIATFKLPRVIEFHDELPRADSGKRLKRHLRDPHWQGMGRRISFTARARIPSPVSSPTAAAHRSRSAASPRG